MNRKDYILDRLEELTRPEDPTCLHPGHPHRGMYWLLQAYEKHIDAAELMEFYPVGLAWSLFYRVEGPAMAHAVKYLLMSNLDFWQLIIQCNREFEEKR